MHMAIVFAENKLRREIESTAFGEDPAALREWIRSGWRERDALLRESGGWYTAVMFPVEKIDLKGGSDGDEARRDS